MMTLVGKFTDGDVALNLIDRCSGPYETILLLGYSSAR